MKPLLGLLLRVVPGRARASLVGDLMEEGVPPGSPGHARAVLGVAAYFQAEPWRNERARLIALLILAAGGLLLWAVTSVMPPSPGVEGLYADPLSRAALRFWAASHLPAALAVGLFAGRAPWLPDAAEPARWHVVGVLAWLAASTAPQGAAVGSFRGFRHRGSRRAAARGRLIASLR